MDPAFDLLAHAVSTCFGNVYLLLKKHCEIDSNITKSCLFSVDNENLWIPQRTEAPSWHS